MSSFYVFTVMDGHQKTYITKQDLLTLFRTGSDIECTPLTMENNYSVKYNQTLDVYMSSKLLEDLEVPVICTPTLPDGEIPDVKDIIDACKKNSFQVDLYKAKQGPNQSLYSGFILFKVLGKDEWLFYWIERISHLVFDVEIDHWRRGGNDLQSAVKLEYSEELGWSAAHENKPVPKFGSTHLSPAFIFRQSRGEPQFGNMEDVFKHMKKFILTN